MKYPLHDAVQKADAQEVIAAIQRGATLDELDELGNSPLH